MFGGRPVSHAIRRIIEEGRQVLRGIRHLYADGIVGIFRPNYRRILSLSTSQSASMRTRP